MIRNCSETTSLPRGHSSVCVCVCLCGQVFSVLGVIGKLITDKNDIRDFDIPPESSKDCQRLNIIGV